MALKVIHIDENIEYLTVDSDLISVDNDIITVDATVSSTSNVYTLTIPYRFYCSNVRLVLWNEIKQVETIFEITVTPLPGEMGLEFAADFEDGETFEVRVFQSGTDNLVWRGKILATTQSDLENYTLHKMTGAGNNIIKI